jgi:hypothetical protein
LHPLRVESVAWVMERFADEIVIACQVENHDAGGLPAGSGCASTQVATLAQSPPWMIYAINPDRVPDDG